MSLKNLLAVLCLSLTIPASTILQTACVADEDVSDEAELDALLDAADPYDLPDDAKGDLAGGATTVRAARYGSSFAVATYDAYGYELSRMSGTHSGARQYGTITGYGGTVAVDVTTKRDASGTVTVTGWVAGQAYSMTKKVGQNPTGTGSLVLTSKQQLLLNIWGAMLPTVMERAKADLADCIGAIGAVIGYAALCSPYNPFTWGACSSLVDAIGNAYRTCSDALN